MHYFLRIATVLLFASQCFSSGWAQVPSSTFMIHWEGGDVEYGQSVAEAPDGNYIIAGEIGFGPGGYDALLMKVDPGGSQIWSRAYGGATGEAAKDVKVTRDGGLIFVGQTSSFGSGNTDMLIVKTDANGIVIWARAIGGTAVDYAQSVDTTSDGGFFVTGYTYSFGAGSADFYAIKLDASGNVQWSRVVGGPGVEDCLSGIQVSDGGYVLSGSTNSLGAGSNDIYVVKLDASGVVQWIRVWGGGSFDQGRRMTQLSTGELLLGGITNSAGAGGSDGFLIKFDLNGNVLLSRTFGSPGLDRILDVFESYDQRIIATGEGTTNTFGSGDQQIFKTDLNFNLIWARHYGTNVDETGFGHAIETRDRGILLSGWDDNDEDFLVTKADSLGILACNNAPMSISVNNFFLLQNTGGAATTGGNVVNVALPSSSHFLTPVVYCSVILSLDELALNGRALAGGSNELFWETDGFPGLSGFEIQRSRDGENFEVVGIVAQQENVASEGQKGRQQNPAKYLFIDTPGDNGLWYYRLRLLEQGEESRFSELVFLENGGQGRVIIKVNEGVRRGFMLDGFDAGGAFSWRILDVLGRVTCRGNGPGEIDLSHTGGRGNLLIVEIRQGGGVWRRSVVR